MILVQAHNISKFYGAEPILENIQLEVRKGERVGLVGVNGAGKSTLLRIMTGELSHDGGEVIKAKDISFGYLDQHTGLESDLSIWDELKTVFAPLLEQEKQLRKIEQRMTEESATSTSATYESLLQEYAQLSEDFREKGGYQYEATMRNVLHGFGFGERDASEKISSLSGGQKTRLALAKLLLQKPDLLILDEPTNHLDLATLSWLEQYLKGYPGGILMVSHDRYFLDALANVIYEIERHRATKFTGNYSAFLDEKAARYEQQLKMYRAQQKEIAQMEDFVQRNIVRASTTKRAQSRRKALEKMERIDRPQGDLRRAYFQFDENRASGHDVLHVEQLAVGYQGQAVMKNINLQAYRGDRIAVVGPNGIGKTTLLKTLVGQYQPIQGSFRFGAHVQLAYYDQEQQSLHPDKTILSEIWDDYPNMLERDVRTLLGQFLFSGEDVNKKVYGLSGGEKARLTLAKLILQKPNVLIMDEPTNHLDVFSKEVLEGSLLDYPGTIIFVSHDRYFLNRIATKVVECQSQGVQVFLGDYDYYITKKQELEELKSLQEKKMQEQQGTKYTDAHSQSSGKPFFQPKASGTQQQASSSNAVQQTEGSSRDSYAANKERAKLERQLTRRKVALEEEIEATEERIEALEAELCLPEVYQDYQRAQELQEQIDSLKAKLEASFDEWSKVEEELEQLTL